MRHFFELKLIYFFAVVSQLVIAASNGCHSLTLKK